MRVEAPTFNNANLKHRKPFVSLKETMLRARSVFGKSVIASENTNTPFPIIEKLTVRVVHKSGDKQALEALRRATFRTKIAVASSITRSIYENLVVANSSRKGVEDSKGSEKLYRKGKGRSPRCIHGRRKSDTSHKCEDKIFGQVSLIRTSIKPSNTFTSKGTRKAA